MIPYTTVSVGNFSADVGAQVMDTGPSTLLIPPSFGGIRKDEGYSVSNMFTGKGYIVKEADPSGQIPFSDLVFDFSNLFSVPTLVPVGEGVLAGYLDPKLQSGLSYWPTRNPSNNVSNSQFTINGSFIAFPYTSPEGKHSFLISRLASKRYCTNRRLYPSC